ncbi:MAG: anaerobic carbon-monoxide dehydrogenase catalytic subunit [Thermoplasmata archaeon]|nr:anaerobic carbon-monoxide dehydrogenase catalytic subunit [Thermoplasmata archaeon]TFG70988.1 MAG: anaerobic carbon-monoxide dehydrogenase catalytic subunit [Methanomassiliicoccus sp.]
MEKEIGSSNKGGASAKSSSKWSCDCWDESCRAMFTEVHGEGICTVLDRASDQGAQCRFGSLGLCCRICLEGPCRINPMGKEPTSGICGAKDYTIVARNLDRMIVGGTASHSCHGKEISHVLLEVSEGKITDYRVTDESKLEKVAARLGIDKQGKGMQAMAREVALAALEDYSRYSAEPLTFLKTTVTKSRMENWDFNAVLPSNINTTISDLMHRTSMGVDADPVPLLFGGVKCALADYAGAQISSDLSDILFGTPKIVLSEVNLNVLEKDAVNVAVHGHNPLLSDIIVDVAREMTDVAKSVGASRFNIVGVCCTGNEILMRKGVPIASNVLSQELVVLSGMLDAMVLDYQCFMPSLSSLTRCTHTRLISTEEVARLVGDTHIELTPGRARTSAKEILTIAAEAFKHRTETRTLPAAKPQRVVAGFSIEQMKQLFATKNPEDPFQHLVDGIMHGSIRGIALFAGCKSTKAKDDRDVLTIAKELLKRDVLVMATGCNAIELAKAGFMDPDKVGELVGEGLQSFLSELAKAADVKGGLPCVWHIGSCVDNPRFSNLATEVANRLDVDIDKIPFVVAAPEAMHEKAVSIGTWAVTMGFPVHVGTINYIYGSTLVTEVLENTARDVFGGYFIFEKDPIEAAKRMYSAIEYRRWKLDLSDAEVERATHLDAKKGTIKKEELFKMAIEGSIIATGYADLVLSHALRKHGPDKVVEFPETGYQLPSIFAWLGKDCNRLGDLPQLLGEARRKIVEEPTYEAAVASGEATMIAAEIVEALKYIDNPAPYEGTPYCGFVPDRILRQLGIAFVDDTIPGAAVFVGRASDPKKLSAMIRDCQNKGMLIVASYDIIKQLKDENIAMGLDRMLYPVGEFTQIIHGLNFAIRAALSFGGIQKGDREGLSNYLSKRPKAFVLQLGPLDFIKVAAEFAVLFNGSPTITDQDVEPIPDKYVVQKNLDEMISTAIEVRGCKIKLGAIDLPVPYGPAFEGETIRRPDMHIEAGGPSKTLAFELLRMRTSEEITDGNVTLIGKDIDEMEEGSSTNLGIFVSVYGKNMQKDFESVLERRIHQFANFAEGLWHTGQRNLLWVRMSKTSVKAGLRLKHIGDILVTKLKQEFGAIVSKIEVTIVTDEDELRKHLDEAKVVYAERDARIADLVDENVDTFYTCTLCQSFAPGHVCIVTPERLGLCGAINWLDAKASHQIAPTGPNSPVSKKETIDEVKGQWTGVNEAVKEKTQGKLQQFSAYTMVEDPMTSCGCFECIVAVSPDLQGVVVVNREHAGMTPVGMTFSTLAGSVGGGIQTPGFIGVGRKYLTSKKFISADGGFIRIVWMPKNLKEAMKDELKKRAEEIGVPDFLDKIADERVARTPDELTSWLVEVNHPVMGMPPMIK